MKRLLTALCLLTAVNWMASDRAFADYLEIKVDLAQIGNISAKAPTPPKAAPVQPGLPPGMQPGMQPGVPPGGARGGGGPNRGGGKGGAKGGRGGSAFNDSLPRFRDGLVLVGGGGVPTPPGVDGQPFDPNMIPGMPPPTVQLPDEASRNWVTAYIEVKGKPIPVQGKQIVRISHKWGKDLALSLDPVIFQYRPIAAEPPAFQFDRKFRKEIKDSKDRPQHLVYIAEWALSLGLNDKFQSVVEEIQKANPKHPAVVNVARVKADLKKPITATDPALQPFLDELRSEGYRPLLSEQGHYGIMAKVPLNQSKDLELKSRLNLFEETMQNFYNWFALQDMPQPAMPAYKQWIVLPESVKDFDTLHAAWGDQPLAGDGFTLRNHNVVILSPERLDDAYATLHKNNLALWNSVKTSKEEFVTGTVWNRPEASGNMDSLSKLQTMTMVEKLLEEDGLRQTITHHGSRQLLTASGLLPDKVDVPEWLMAGLASFFETSRDSVYGNGGFLPSWEHLVTFKQFRLQKKLDPAESDKALLGVLTDSDFMQAAIFRSMEKQTPEGMEKDAAGERADDMAYLSKSTAWALTYYLFKSNKLDKLARFCQEFNDLPRDRVLTDSAYIGAFAKAFDLTDSADPRKLDAQKFRDFANQWFVEMQSTTLDLPQIEQEALAPYMQK